MCNFSSSYRPFTSYWWRHWFRLRTYTHPFVFAYQRVFRGWADCDTWNLDNWLSTIIPPAIEHLRDETTSHPYRVTEDEWNEILTEIADGFDAANRDDVIPVDLDGLKEYQTAEMTKFENGMKLFTKYYKNLWD